jgi:hypothetical protein
MIYGWPAVAEILQDEGQYGYLCKDVRALILSILSKVYKPLQTSPCDAQITRVDMIFTIASAITTASVLTNGMILDR